MIHVPGSNPEHPNPALLTFFSAGFASPLAAAAAAAFLPLPAAAAAGVAGLVRAATTWSGSTAARHVMRAPLDTCAVHTAGAAASAPLAAAPPPLPPPNLRVSHSLMVPSLEAVASEAGRSFAPAEAANEAVPGVCQWKSKWQRAPAFVPPAA